MATLTQIRTGLAANLATIPGLRTTATVPDDISPPIAVTFTSTITYDETFGRGLDRYEFSVLVIVGRVDARTSQNTLDAYCAPSGASSIKTAIESNRTLGGIIQDLRVTEMRNYGASNIQSVDYLTAEFVVTVYA